MIRSNATRSARSTVAIFAAVLLMAVLFTGTVAGASSSYVSGENITLNLVVNVNADTPGVIKLMIYNPSNKLIGNSTNEITLKTGKNTLNVTAPLTTNMDGLHYVRYDMFANLSGTLTLITSSTQYFDAEVNDPPIIKLLSPVAGGIYNFGDEIEFSANATDPEGMTTSVRWASNVSGDIGTTSSFSKVLKPDGTHLITITAEDALGVKAISNFNIKVNKTDYSKPILYNVSASINDASSMVISWETNEPADGVVNYRNSTFSNNITQATLTTAHSITLTGLALESNYVYNVNSTDKSDNTNTSIDYNFNITQIVPTPGQDVILPVMIADSSVKKPVVNVPLGLDIIIYASEVSSPAPANIVSAVIDFSANKTFLGTPITITLGYNASMVTDPSKLKIAYYDTALKAWVDLSDIFVNTTAHTVSGTINHFTAFAVIEMTTTVSNVDSSVGGGGGGGSGTSGEAFENIKVKDVIQEYIVANSVVTYKFKEDANAISFVTFDAITNAGYISATVEVLNHTSTLVSSAPSGKVYQNMNIWIGKSGYATEKNIANPVVGFKVAKSWITGNDIDVSTIKLNRYNEEKWNALPTTKTDEDDIYIYFESQTPGFSPFAITGYKFGAIVTETIASTTTPKEDEQMPSEDDSSNSSIYAIAIVMVILLGAIAFAKRDEIKEMFDKGRQ